jgi:hypothetical protein
MKPSSISRLWIGSRRRDPAVFNLERIQRVSMHRLYKCIARRASPEDRTDLDVMLRSRSEGDRSTITAPVLDCGKSTLTHRTAARAAHDGRSTNRDGSQVRFTMGREVSVAGAVVEPRVLVASDFPSIRIVRSLKDLLPF